MSTKNANAYHEHERRSVWIFLICVCIEIPYLFCSPPAQTQEHTLQDNYHWHGDMEDHPGTDHKFDYNLDRSCNYYILQSESYIFFQ